MEINDGKKEIVNESIIQKENNINNILSQKDIIIEKVMKINGEIEIFRYFKNRLLGKGGFAKVYEVTCEWSNEKYACKEISLKRKRKNFNLENIFEEINLHKTLIHPNILKYIHSFSDESNIYILTELCEHQTLKALLKKRKILTELEIQYYALQIINAIKYMNDNNVFHRDLKLSNIFITDNMKLKIADFGLSTIIYNPYKHFSHVGGTKYYIAPEMLESYTWKFHSDVWSFGVILYALCTGRLPFICKNSKKYINCIYMKYYRKPYKFRKVSSELCDLINKIFQYIPEERPTWIEILNHDFFKIGKSIPRTLPISTLENPPSVKFIREYMPNADEKGFIGTKKKIKKKIFIEEQTIYEKNISTFDKYNSELNSRDKKYNLHYNIYDQDVEYYLKNHESNQNFINNVERNKGLKQPEIYVKEYINEKHSFGLVYLLTNGFYGIYYNNNSRIIADSELKNYYYIFIKDKKVQGQHHKKTDKVDKQLEKDLERLKIYKDYLDKKTNKKIPPLEGLYADEVDEQEDNKIIKDPDNDTPIHVKFWIKLKQAISFSLTDGTFQTIFEDNTQIILSIKYENVTYIDFCGKIWLYKGREAFCNNTNIDMKTRLKYVEKMINIMQEINNENQNSII